MVDGGSGSQLAVSQSGRVMLSCPVVAGDPPPAITWLKNDSVVAHTERTRHLNNGSLVIYDVTVSSGLSRLSDQGMVAMIGG